MCEHLFACAYFTTWHFGLWRWLQAEMQGIGDSPVVESPSVGASARRRGSSSERPQVGRCGLVLLSTHTVARALCDFCGRQGMDQSFTIVSAHHQVKFISTSVLEPAERRLLLSDMAKVLCRRNTNYY